MNRMLMAFCLALNAAFVPPCVLAQSPGTAAQKSLCQTSQTGLTNVVATYKAAQKLGSVDEFGVAAYWFNEDAKEAQAAAPRSTTAGQAGTAQARTDQQTTASAGAAGSTSTTSKGSVPWLLGLAEEYGGLTQSVSGSVTTVNGNIANIIKAINTKDYQASFNAWPHNELLSLADHASFSLAFNTGTSSSSTSTSASPSAFSSATAHIDLYNHRDPRDAKWTKAWASWANTPANNLPQTGQDFQSEVEKKFKEEYSGWQKNALTTLSQLDTYLKTTKDTSADQDTEISKRLSTVWSSFNSQVCSLESKDPALLDANTKYDKALDAYERDYKSVQSQINNSPVFSFEYTFTNQASVALPKSTTQTYSIGTTAPDLSNFNFIFEFPLSKDGSTQFTANAGFTLFTAPSAQLKLTPVRDFKVTAEADYPLPSIVVLSKSTLSLSMLVQDLLQEPLGQQVTVNGVAVTSTGTIVLGQAKWTFPAGTSGVTFPVSFTASNRTDLIKETTVKGSIGVSYNLDSLFSQLKK